MATTRSDTDLIPRDLPDKLKAVYRTLLDVKRENDAHKIKPPPLIVITDLAKDYDDLLAMVLYKELHRLGLVELRGVVANLMPAKTRAGFGRGALDLLGLPQVPVAEGTRGLPQSRRHEVHDYEFDCTFVKEEAITEQGEDMLYRLLRAAMRENEKVILLCLSSLRDIGQFSRKFPNLLRRSLGKVVLQGGYSVVDGNLVVNTSAANNKFDLEAATTFHAFLQNNQIPSMVFDRNAATNLKHPLQPAMFTDMASTGGLIGQYLDHIAEQQESTFFLAATGPAHERFGYVAASGTEKGSEGLDWNRYKARTRWPKDQPQPTTFAELRPYTNIIAYDALAAASVMGDEAMVRLKTIVTPRSEWPNTIHQVVGNGSEPNSLDGTGDGMCITLEALLRGSLLAVTQGLSSNPA
jgi:inosine-uridine nucleoside N-ribohydrolase